MTDRKPESTPTDHEHQHPGGHESPPEVEHTMISDEAGTHIENEPDADGYWRDEFGNRVDHQGRRVDEDGNPVNARGERIDPTDEPGWFVPPATPNFPR